MYAAYVFWKRSVLHLPVAVTPQVTLNKAVERAGNVGVNVIHVDCRAANVSGVGDTVTDVAGVEVKVTVVQFSPVTAGSRKTEPLMDAGPRLAMVTV